MNVINGKSYIGKTKNVKRRFKQHLNNAFSENPKVNLTSPKFYRAIRKYGKEVFLLEIIEENIECEFQSYYREEYWIKFYNSIQNGYNIIGKPIHMLSGKENPNYGTRKTEDHKKRMSEKFKGDKNPFFGKNHTEENMQSIIRKNKELWLNPEYKKRQSDIHKGNFGEKNPFFGKNHTEEFKIRKSEQMKGVGKGGNGKSIYKYRLIYLSTNEEFIFVSLMDFCNEYYLKFGFKASENMRSSIRRALRGDSEIWKVERQLKKKD